MSTWKQRRDPLFRGDGEGGVQLPTPGADPSVVRHILYLDGPGRPTPYVSTTESRDVAEGFAKGGRVYQTRVPDWAPHGVVHLSRKELLSNLRGVGKGRARWPSAQQVMTARRYVEEAAEHLADFSGVVSEDLRGVVDAVFPPGRR
ncbi:MAG: hypothetical protein H6732_13030 [Alphaproteobacteria bacterium]|nr:hypothetical protein [Alphaproteobacteria bacterium]